MRLTKQTGHAIRILLDCAQSPGQLVKVAEISERLNITKQNAFKIVHILSRAGFISAFRGPSGGVKLSQPPSNIRIGDVVRAIEVTRVRVEDAGKPASRNADSNSLNAVFDDALGAFIAVLDQHTLAELAAAGGNLAEEVTPRKKVSSVKRQTAASAKAGRPAARRG